MAGQWKGKSKGTVLGYKIFIFFIKKLGVRAAYGLLYFVAFYYFLFSLNSSKSIYKYYRNRLDYSSFKSIIHIYKSYLIFGKTIIDKVAISSGLRNQFTYEFDGVETIIELLEKRQGGIMISAHVGNFEIAEFFFDEIDTRSQIHLVTTDAERRNIKEYMEKVTVRSKIKFILVQDDMSHIFEINNALSEGELVCFTGDRYMSDTKVMTETILGAPASFPAGPFLLASRLKVPVLFVYVMKETNKHYHLYSRKADFENRDAQGLLKEFTKSVEWVLKKYPTQWFNYFDFWGEEDKSN